MKIFEGEKVIRKKTRTYFFKMKKYTNGYNNILDTNFRNHKEDIMEVAKILQELPEGHVITVAFKVEE